MFSSYNRKLLKHSLSIVHACPAAAAAAAAAHHVQVDSGFHPHRASAAWGCSAQVQPRSRKVLQFLYDFAAAKCCSFELCLQAAEHAAAAALYCITVCIADTPAAVRSNNLVLVLKVCVVCQCLIKRRWQRRHHHYHHRHQGRGPKLCGVLSPSYGSYPPSAHQASPWSSSTPGCTRLGCAGRTMSCLYSSALQPSCCPKPQTPPNTPVSLVSKTSRLADPRTI